MIAITEDQAFGRLVEAGRILAGLDQGELGALAGVSGSTISNIENGHKTTSQTRKSVRRALREKGVNFGLSEDQILLGIAFVDKNKSTDDED
jgi:transcriptional regulator with XRE-family HTH domain